MQPTLDPKPISLERPQYFDYIVKNIEYLVNTQNDDGSWGEKDLSEFQRIYYTTQVVQCLLRAGFPLTSETIQKSLVYLDNFKEPSIENRAKFFLYTALDKISEDDLRKYLELLKDIQKEDGSFFYEIRSLKRKEVATDGWPAVRRGSFMFYTLHVLHLLSMISDKKDKSVVDFKNSICKKSMEMLLKQLKEGKPENTLRDPTSGQSDPELTAYCLSLLQKTGHQIHNFPEVVTWLLSRQVEGSWLNNSKATSFIVIDLSTLRYDDSLLPDVKNAVSEGMRWLINHKEEWETNPNLTALVISALIFGNTFLDPTFYDSFCVNYSEELRKKVAEKEGEILRIKKTKKLIAIASFILGIVIPKIIDIAMPFISSLINSLPK